MSTVDLHTHSTASDGILTPAALVAKAAGLGITFLSLTDHDTIDGVKPALEAAQPYPGLTIIPGIELNTDIEGGEIHILGYFINFTDLALKVELERIRYGRQRRAHRIVEKLGCLGINLDWDDIQKLADGGSIGRPHIARAMQEKGHIEHFEDAFNQYIGNGGPAYVEREKLLPEEAVHIVIEAGGVPVLAHPYTSGDPEAAVARLVPEGLAGIEAYYYEHTPEQTDFLVKLADRLGLVATGGSDFHGTGSSGGELGSVDVPLDAANHLILLGTEKRD